MGYNLNYRRWAAIMIILFCAAIAAGSFYWAAWVSVASFFVTLLIVDFLFLDKEDFLYDPDFKVRSVVCLCVCAARGLVQIGVGWAKRTCVRGIWDGMTYVLWVLCA